MDSSGARCSCAASCSIRQASPHRRGQFVALGQRGWGEGSDMKAISRSLVMIFVALIAVPVLAVTQTVTNAIQLLATTVLVMGGTQHPLSPDVDSNAFVNNYFSQATSNYIVPGTN